MPLMVPVFKRELANKMYTPTTYYFGRFFSHMILQLFYPVSFVCIIFWGLEIDQSLENWLMFVLFAGVMNLTMNAQGYFCGVMTTDEQLAQQINTFMILLFMLTSGGLGNVDSFPSFIKYVSYVSPQRYACQGFFSRLIAHVPNEAPDYRRDKMKNMLGYNKYSDIACLYRLIGIFTFFALGGWIIISFKNRVK